MIGDFIDGPLWYFSAAVFLLGVIWRLIAILRIGVTVDLSVARSSGAGGALRTLFSRSLPRRPVLTRGKLQFVAGYMFHLGLFALLFLAQPHVEFISRRITGFGWTTLPHSGITPTMCPPGATTSGLTKPSIVGPVAENVGM